MVNFSFRCRYDLIMWPVLCPNTRPISETELYHSTCIHIAKVSAANLLLNRTCNTLQIERLDPTLAGCWAEKEKKNKGWLSAASNLDPSEHCGRAPLLLLEKYNNSDKTVITTVICLGQCEAGLRVIHLFRPLLFCWGFLTSLRTLRWPYACTPTFNLICFTVASHPPYSNVISSAAI